MRCYQCTNPAMWLVSDQEIPLCLNCYFRYQQLQQAEIENNERMMNYNLDQMAAMVGMPPMGPRFPERPRPVILSGVKMNHINVTNSVVGTLNTGSIGVVDQSITALVQVGDNSLGEALKELSQAILGSKDLTTNQKNELMESLSAISTEAITPKENRKKSVASILIERASQVTSLATDIADACQKWWPIVQAAFA